MAIKLFLSVDLFFTVMTDDYKEPSQFLKKCVSLYDIHQTMRFTRQELKMEIN